MITVADAVADVPERHYTHHPHRGETPHRSNPASICRELTALDLRPGHSVLEIGTGSGYSGAIIHLITEGGRVTSLDVNDHLVGWANLIHHQRHAGGITCHTTDGLHGYPAAAPYDRAIAWCTPPYLPRTWVDQVTDGGRLVVPLPIADVPDLTMIATITVTSDGPRVDAITPGGYIQTATAPRTDFLIPGRWVDWSTHHPAPAWISIAWRADDDRLRTGARTALDLLLTGAHTETYAHAPLDWDSWQAAAAAAGDRHLTVAEMPGQHLAVGHSTATSAAVIHADGRIIADAVDSPSLTALHAHLATWETAGRPDPAAFTARLVPHHSDASPGWDLRLSR